MSDQNPNQPTVVVVPAPAAPAAPASAPAVDDKKTTVSMSSKQLEKRLSEEREKGERKLLKELGIEKGSREEVLAKIKDGLYGLTDKEKIVQEQAAALKQLQEKAKKADALEPVVRDFATQQFEALPEAAKSYITKKAGDDVMSRYSMIQELKESGLLAALTASAKPATEAPKPPNPATTVASDPPTAPKTGTELDEYQQWRALVDSGQATAAANYLQLRSDKIYRLFADKHGGKK